MPMILSLSADDIEEEKSQIEGAKRQSENGRYSVNASIAGGSPQPSKLARTCLPHCRLGVDPVNPLSHWQKKNMSELITR